MVSFNMINFIIFDFHEKHYLTCQALPNFYNLIKGENYCLTPQCVTVASAIINAMDHSVDPCTDFYEYSCGGWVKSNPLPDGKSIWGTFGKLWQENQLIMKNVLGIHFISFYII